MSFPVGSWVTRSIDPFPQGHYDSFRFRRSEFEDLLFAGPAISTRQAKFAFERVQVRYGPIAGMDTIPHIDGSITIFDLIDCSFEKGLQLGGLAATGPCCDRFQSTLEFG
ncbi:hypothetical protein [Aureimonas sp. Leaf454]|uniref:hypothetical protein n=1 Tax=Aureimonas sp. Leaf454 TaxID=1736381 RepID=UPI000A40D4A8|nr:hypothetical protein [Aureimonas sp. Leaf454]